MIGEGTEHTVVFGDLGNELIYFSELPFHTKSVPFQTSTLKAQK